MPKILIGFMGAGKTTIARQLDSNFIDMDTKLIERFGMPISQFFDKFGEIAFRKYEAQLLKELSTSRQVISTGGGIVMLEENRKLLQENIETIFLRADFDTLYQRLLSDPKQDRPLLNHQSKAELKALFDIREPLYMSCAGKIVDVTAKTPKEILEEIR